MKTALALTGLQCWIEYSSCPATDNNDVQLKIALDWLNYNVRIFSTIFAAYVKIFDGFAGPHGTRKIHQSCLVKGW